MTTVPISIIDEAVLEVAAHLPTRVRNVTSWRCRQENELWRELVGAILGSAVSFEHAVSALSMLNTEGLITPSCRLARQQSRIEQCLRCAGYRFPALRSRHIAASATAIYGESKTLHDILASYPDPVKARRGLVDLCPGVGAKQASLFLRNVGYHDLAVLDRHVLTYLRHRQLVTERNVAVSSMERYEFLERIVVNAAAELGLTVADFDLAVWITVRAIRERFDNGTRSTCFRGS